MADLVLFILAAYGAWFVVTQSDLPIWSGLRQKTADKSPLFMKLMSCPVCSGFWVSMLVKLCLSLPKEAAEFLRIPVWGLAGAAAVYLVELHVSKLEEH